jgi:hypothetical protein
LVRVMTATESSFFHSRMAMSLSFRMIKAKGG